jgi:hypothetical protein
MSSHGVELGNAIGVDDFFAEGRDGTGRKTRVPWVRFGSRTRSPSATEGFYVVYLFDALGRVVYLSLNQGTTDFVAGEFIPKPADVVAKRARWAREALASWIAELDHVEPAMALHDPGPLGPGYENGNVVAFAYESNAIPDDASLAKDARLFAGGLGRLYAEHEMRPIPHELPELREAEEAAGRASGSGDSKRRVGFRTNAAEIKVIENHAVALARTYYAKEGWDVKELGKPFDLEVSNADTVLTVEVKGTTSDGSGIPLTAGEVSHHADAFPDNALVIVRGIILDRSGSHPIASGGQLYELRCWEIDSDALRVISYAYQVPSEMYLHKGVPSGLLLQSGSA